MKLAAAPATPLTLKTDVSGNLHRRRPWNHLTKSHPVTKGTAIEPLSLLNGHLTDKWNHGGPAECGRPQF